VVLGFFDMLVDYWPELLSGAWTTVKLTLVGFALSIVIGLVFVLLLLSRNRLVVLVARLYIELVRGIPALVTLFLIYFGLASAGLVLSPFLAASLAFGFIGGAFMAEIYRAGIEAIDAGQWEAAKAVGMNYRTTMRRVILPQAIRVVLPPTTNTGITLLKDTSLVVTIGVPDITFEAYNIATDTYRAMPIYVIAGLTYLAMSYPLSLGVRRLERHLNREAKTAH
jgi:His/Glu/Gln/Arg/opine family amino acid ABC transporter permease subunit